MNLSLPLSHVEAYFILDGEKYEIEQFRTSFKQPLDYKGQPQHEVKGGQIIVTLTRAADYSLYMWAKKSTSLKNGVILFQTDMGMTVLELTFTNAYCVNLTREIDSHTGTTTTLIIAPEKINMNGVEHDNFWKNG